VDLSGLKGLNAKGRVEIGALQVQGLKLANLKTELRAAQGRAEVGPHSAALYEGSLAGTLTLDGNTNRVALKETLNNVAVGPLLRDFAEQDRLEGRGNVSLDVSAAGKTVNALKSALAGTARVHLRDGAIKGVNIGELLRKARSALGSQGAQDAQAADNKEKTDFSELSASFAIKNGVAHNEDLELKAPLFRLGGAGDIDIGKSTINYVAKASVVASAQGQGGKDLEQLAGLTVPVRLSGPLDSMKYDVDYRAVAGDLAKSKVGGKVKEGIEKNREKIEDKVRDRLKGLIGR
jgi:AsmA protein